MKQVMKFLREDDGATAIEYGLIAGLVAVAIIGVLTSMSGSLGGVFTKVKTELDKVSGAGGGGTDTSTDTTGG